MDMQYRVATATGEPSGSDSMLARQRPATVVFKMCSREGGSLEKLVAEFTVRFFHVFSSCCTALITQLRSCFRLIARAANGREGIQWAVCA